MSIVVFSRLAALLEQRQMTVTELRQQIEERFGISVDSQCLDHLSQKEPIEQVDLRISGATAALLGVKLDDLFMVASIPTNGNAAADLDVLAPAENALLTDLFDKQARDQLTEEEWAEMHALITTQGRRLRELSMEERARKSGVPIEQVRRETEAQFAKALAWWDAFNAGHDRERILAEAAGSPPIQWPR